MMTRYQVGILVAGLGALGGMIATLPDWHAAMTPPFIGSTMVAVCTLISGIISKGPQA